MDLVEFIQSVQHVLDETATKAEELLPPDTAHLFRDAWKEVRPWLDEAERRVASAQLDDALRFHGLLAGAQWDYKIDGYSRALRLYNDAVRAGEIVLWRKRLLKLLNRIDTILKSLSIAGQLTKVLEEVKETLEQDLADAQEDDEDVGRVRGDQ